MPRKSVVRLTDSPDMTLDIYRGRRTTTQQQQQYSAVRRPKEAECIGIVDLSVQY